MNVCRTRKPFVSSHRSFWLLMVQGNVFLGFVCLYILLFCCSVKDLLFRAFWLIALFWFLGSFYFLGYMFWKRIPLFLSILVSNEQSIMRKTISFFSGLFWIFWLSIDDSVLSYRFPNFDVFLLLLVWITNMCSKFCDHLCWSLLEFLWFMCIWSMGNGV